MRNWSTWTYLICEKFCQICLRADLALRAALLGLGGGEPRLTTHRVEFCYAQSDILTIKRSHNDVRPVDQGIQDLLFFIAVCSGVFEFLL